MSNILDNYELSIWSVDGKVETKIATIGGPNMASSVRAQDLKITRNINGTKSLTFSLYYKCLDELTGEFYINPFCNLIGNETRLKLRKKDKWYEFIVKNVTKDSENKKYTYIAEDAFITELSRKGFDIELSTDLKNNQGTILELEKTILQKSDWSVDEKNSIVSPQTKDEVLIRLKVSNAFFASEKTSTDEEGRFIQKQSSFLIPKDSYIYTFYSTIYNKEAFFQFYYSSNGIYNFDDEGNIIDCPLYTINNYNYINDNPQNTTDYQLTTFKGKKLIRSQQSQYDDLVEKYVKIYKNNSFNNIKGYTETEYSVDNFVSNLATNGEDFVTDIGWYPIGGTGVELYTFPDTQTILANLEKYKDAECKSYIKISPNYVNTNLFYNSGFEDNKNNFSGIYSGQKFVTRIKYKCKKNNNQTDLSDLDINRNTNGLDSGFKISLCEYTIDSNGNIKVGQALCTTSLTGSSENTFKKEGEYWTAICTINKTYSEAALADTNFGLFFSYELSSNLTKINSTNIKNITFYIEDFQFFEYKEKEESDIGYYVPGDTISGESKIKYYYYNGNVQYESKEDIEYLYQGYKEQNYDKVYYNNYQQIRTIEGKESNIYNLTQTLCETFDCWADFNVEHDELGYIQKDSKGNLIKKIAFKPYIGKNNWAGFKYGINLKSIQRTTESKQITTKTIVKANTNEFAPNGFCTIAYADENPSGESFIYDFRYYENQGLINSEKLSKDLYGQNGLYAKLKKLNSTIEDETNIRTEIGTQLLYLEKEKEVLDALVSELLTEINTEKKDFKSYSGTTYENFLNLSKAQKDEKLEEVGVSESFLKIFSNTQELKTKQAEFETIKEDYKKEKNKYNESKRKIKELTQQKENLIFEFETKYTSFIQEGTWISEEYIDHNLYYVDAKTTAAVSSLPQATYTINVVDISSIEEYKNYSFDIGDKTYITDPEFFGYVLINGFYSPRKQEVIISEIIEELDNPSNNKITVQNFKTQFDDLFQRITATTQQLQLNNGTYQRAASAFSNLGLNPAMAQTALNSDNFILKNNTNRWTTEGFVSTNNKDNRQFLKIHNGSLSLTEDGGKTWGVAINGKGINANYIYAGQLDAGKINIVSELKTSENQKLEYALQMDKDGISMYSYELQKQLRLRLGKVLEDGEFSKELYGLQLYNNEGIQTFKTDSNGDIIITGTVYATDGEFSGEIRANSGEIGGWIIDTYQLNHFTENNLDALINTGILSNNYVVNTVSKNDWRLLFGIDKNRSANFGVDSSGNLYANGVDIKDGNISFGDIFKITTEGGQTGAVKYGLNIDLMPENEDKAIVIESDDEVIGIREKTEDGKWTWKTILGNLENATLGGKSLKEDYKLEGYGLCTENGLFSGTIIANEGEIGGWHISENSLNRINEEDGIFLGKPTVNNYKTEKYNYSGNIEEEEGNKLTKYVYFYVSGVEENGETSWNKQIPFFDIKESSSSPSKIYIDYSDAEDENIKEDEIILYTCNISKNLTVKNLSITPVGYQFLDNNWLKHFSIEIREIKGKDRQCVILKNKIVTEDGIEEFFKQKCLNKFGVNPNLGTNNFIYVSFDISGSYESEFTLNFFDEEIKDYWEGDLITGTKIYKEMLKSLFDTQPTGVSLLRNIRIKISLWEKIYKQVTKELLCTVVKDSLLKFSITEDGSLLSRLTKDNNCFISLIFEKEDTLSDEYSKTFSFLEEQYENITTNLISSYKKIESESYESVDKKIETKIPILNTVASLSSSLHLENFYDLNKTDEISIIGTKIYLEDNLDDSSNDQTTIIRELGTKNYPFTRGYFNQIIPASSDSASTLGSLNIPYNSVVTKTLYVETIRPITTGDTELEIANRGIKADHLSTKKAIFDYGNGSGIYIKNNSNEPSLAMAIIPDSSNSEKSNFIIGSTSIANTTEYTRIYGNQIQFIINNGSNNYAYVKPYYSIGDTITINNLTTAGYTLSNNQSTNCEIHFSFTADKPIFTGTSLAVTSSSFTFRQNRNINGYTNPQTTASFSRTSSPYNYIINVTVIVPKGSWIFDDTIGINTTLSLKIS